MKNKQNSTNQAKDTGLALILILLLVAHFKQQTFLILPAIFALVLTMTWPILFEPLARVWFGFSHLLGSVVSKIILTIIFFLVVTPVALILQMRGTDSMRIKMWKKNGHSAFMNRNHTFSGKDLEKTY